LEGSVGGKINGGGIQKTAGAGGKEGAFKSVEGKVWLKNEKRGRPFKKKGNAQKPTYPKGSAWVYKAVGGGVDATPKTRKEKGGHQKVRNCQSSGGKKKLYLGKLLTIGGERFNGKG